MPEGTQKNGAPLMRPRPLMAFFPARPAGRAGRRQAPRDEAPV